MKVYLAAIAGHVPSEMVQCISAFMDFCYIARRNAISSSDLTKLQELLSRFQELRTIFADTGVTETLAAPRQHAMTHYIRSIELFGAPNGLCSSITESQHIRSIKKPWRSSNRCNPLHQMTLKVLRLEKLAALRSSLEAQGLMWGSTSQYMAHCLLNSHDNSDYCDGSDDESHSDSNLNSEDPGCSYDIDSGGDDDDDDNNSNYDNDDYDSNRNEDSNGGDSGGDKGLPGDGGLEGNGQCLPTDAVQV